MPPEATEEMKMARSFMPARRVFHDSNLFLPAGKRVSPTHVCFVVFFFVENALIFFFRLRMIRLGETFVSSDIHDLLCRPNVPVQKLTTPANYAIPITIRYRATGFPMSDIISRKIRFGLDDVTTHQDLATFSFKKKTLQFHFTLQAGLLF